MTTDADQEKERFHAWAADIEQWPQSWMRRKKARGKGPAQGLIVSKRTPFQEKRRTEKAIS